MDAHRDFSVVRSCRDGYHLRESCGEVECPGMYHCANSYCIPVRKICDGQLDCPAGDDERDCDSYVCPGLLHCKDTDMCIPHHEICDGVVQCPLHGEDEKYCNQNDTLCDDCLCHGHIVYCEAKNIVTLYTPSSSALRPYRALFLAYNNLTTLSGNPFRGLHWLRRLDLSHNRLNSLGSGVFDELVNLKELDLSYNRLGRLSRQSFQGLAQLEVLNLNHNELVILRQTEMNWLISLHWLQVEGNRLDSVEQGTFSQLVSLQTLNADAFKICCVAKHVTTCTPEADEFSSCEDLMANYTLQIAIWVLGVVALIGNTFVIVWRLKTDRKKSSSFFIINLGCSDFLMGVYMIIIASVDVHFRGNYIVHADSWRASWLCQLVGVIATLSSEASVFILTTITMERCLTLIYPLKFGQMSLSKAKIVAGCGWVICLFLSVLPLSKAPLFGDAYFGRTGVCLPFVVSSQRLPGWEYSVFIFLVLNLASFMIIFIGYTAIFVTVKSSIHAMGDKSTSSADEYSLAKKLAIIVATDFMIRSL